MRYGSAVQLEYVDLVDPEAQAQFPELASLAQENGWPYPLIAVNGQLKTAGSAHYYVILPLVEQALEEEKVASP